MSIYSIFLILVLGMPALTWAQLVSQETGQVSPATASEPAAAPDDLVTIFPQHTWNRFWFSGQANIIEQWHGDFPALYSGPHSLSNSSEHGASRILTLYTAGRITKLSDFVFHLEDASGFGLSNSQGLAGYTNIDVVRIPGEGSPLSTAPYVARAIFRQVIPLSSEREEAEPGPMGRLDQLPERRVEFRIGHFSLADFFDVNGIGSDSHLQFMNWTVVNNGAWDYAADTRGYTYGAFAELHEEFWSLRFAEALMPTIANGIDLQWSLRRARAHNLEVEFRPHLLSQRKTSLRLLAYRNVADMGNYRQAINDFLAHRTSTPDIIASRAPGRTKNGVGFNAEQELTSDLRIYARLGWNDGRNESFAFTEVDGTGSMGGDLEGERWHRKHDKIGGAFVINAISADHREYLALGGLGFLLGDGALNYGRERIVEIYYTAHIWRGVFGAFDLQHINNPGYNRDRGPVWVPALRAHFDF
jgi:hypothetical protein